MYRLKKSQFTYLALLLVVCIIALGVINSESVTNQTSNIQKPNYVRVLNMTINNLERNQTILFPIDNSVFNIMPIYEKDGKTVSAINADLKPDLMNFYHKIGFPKKSENVVVIYPILTQAAYGPHGFYDYYSGKCDKSCLAVSIPQNIEALYSASQGSTIVLSMLNYSFISDIDVDRNPHILEKYDKVILLHNEYVTQNEFNSILSHPNVVFLYPNSLYAQVNINYSSDQILLVKGHGYPTHDIKNGFNWKFDNSEFEFDINCNSWQFSKITNGKMLNCYPDYRIFYDERLLSEIRN